MGTLSIIIPTKNRKEFLRITVDNLLKQTRIPDEIIVVDDHSSDGTLDFLNSAYNGQVRGVTNKGHGPGAARNTGFQHSTGEYIKFFDSDDILSLNSLEVQLKDLEKSGQEMVYSPYVHARFSSGKWLQKDVIIQFYPIPKGKSLRDCMAYGFFSVIPGMTFRRSLIETIGPWREDIIAYEDWDYLWRIGQLVQNPRHTNECLMIYRIHDQQTTGNQRDDNYRDQNRLKCLSRILKDPNLPLKLRFLLKVELYSTKALLNKNNGIPPIYKMGRLFKRLRNKYQRLITGTNWEVYHGVKNKSIHDYSF